MRSDRQPSRFFVHFAAETIEEGIDRVERQHGRTLEVRLYPTPHGADVYGSAELAPLLDDIAETKKGW
jgi:hypothetical protein